MRNLVIRYILADFVRGNDEICRGDADFRDVLTAIEHEAYGLRVDHRISYSEELYLMLAWTLSVSSDKSLLSTLDSQACYRYR